MKYRLKLNTFSMYPDEIITIIDALKSKGRWRRVLGASSFDQDEIISQLEYVLIKHEDENDE